MKALIALITGALASISTLQAMPDTSGLVQVANEVSAEEMVGYIRGAGLGGVTVDDSGCLDLIGQLTPTIWGEMNMGEPGQLKSVDVTYEGITYNFEDGTSATFEFDVLLDMLK